MRIAILASNIFDLLSGQQKIQRAVLDSLSSLGHELLILTNDRTGRGDPPDKLRLDKHTLSVLPGDATTRTYLKGWLRYLTSIRHFQPDILFSFGGASAILAWSLRWVKRLPWVQFVYEIHSFDSPMGKYYRSCLRQADCVICTSEYIKNILITHDEKVEKYKVLKYNFGDPEITSVKDGSDNVSGPKTILYWGDAAEGRGVEVLIEAISARGETTDTDFTFIFRFVNEDFRERATELNRIQGVRVIEGTLPSPELKEHLSKADIIILPYTQTTIQPPLTLLESIGSGKLVITTDIEANREILGEDGDGGILIPPNDSNYLGEALEEAISNYDRRLKRLGRFLDRERWLAHPNEDELRAFLSRIIKSVTRP